MGWDARCTCCTKALDQILKLAGHKLARCHYFGSCEIQDGSTPILNPGPRFFETLDGVTGVLEGQGAIAPG